MRSLLGVIGFGVSVAFGLFFAGAASALPALQLGPGSGSWSYEDETWVGDPSGGAVELAAYANAQGGSGAYAWDPAGSTTQTAYLVFSAIPTTTSDSFNITVQNDGVALAIYTSGLGTPPLSGANGLINHGGFFPTYFEIYEFNFDGGAGLISNTQPGDPGTGLGYTELFTITLNSLVGDGVHVDLFTVEGSGILSLTGTSPMKKVAPFSHDATITPEPSAALVFVTGFLVVGLAIRRPRAR